MSHLDRVRAEGLKLAPWHLGVEIAPGLTTEDLHRESGRPEPFYDPRPSLKELFTSLFPNGLDGRSVLDCACNNGAYLFALKELGAGECYGSDVRRQWIDQARFLVEHREGPKDAMRFEVADVYDLPQSDLAPFDVTIFSGVFYHLPDPIRALQIASDLTKELLFVSTATRADHPDDLLVAGRESKELELSGVHGLAFFPTGPRIISRILTWIGFPAIRCVNWWNPPGSAPEQDSLQLVAAREKRFLEEFESRRPAGMEGLLSHVRETVRPRARVLFASPDGEDPPQLPYRETIRFPQQAGSGASDARALIAELDRLREAGAEYLVVPSAALSWLDERAELKSFLDLRYAAVRDPRSCILYELRTSAAARSPARTAPSV